MDVIDPLHLKKNLKKKKKNLKANFLTHLNYTTE